MRSHNEAGVIKQHSGFYYGDRECGRSVSYRAVECSMTAGRIGHDTRDVRIRTEHMLDSAYSPYDILGRTACILRLLDWSD